MTAPDGPLEAPFELAQRAARALAERSGAARHDVAVVLGSGWGDAAELVAPDAVVLERTELPGFAPTGTPGHASQLRSGLVHGRRVLVAAGRTHLYEGHSPAAVVHGVRTAVLAGCAVVLLTNAAGSLRAELAVGGPVLVSDHLNLTGASPLSGPAPPPPLPGRFVDLTECYSPRLRALARDVDPGLAEGVYAALAGPTYETPAEIRMLRTLGADLVGMSTALEAIAARHLGAEVLAVSLVTNQAAGMAAQALDHADVLAAGVGAGPALAGLLRGVIERLGPPPERP